MKRFLLLFIDFRSLNTFSCGNNDRMIYFGLIADTHSLLRVTLSPIDSLHDTDHARLRLSVKFHFSIVAMIAKDNKEKTAVK